MMFSCDERREGHNAVVTDNDNAVMKYSTTFHNQSQYSILDKTENNMCVENYSRTMKKLNAPILFLDTPASDEYKD